MRPICPPHPAGPLDLALFPATPAFPATLPAAGRYEVQLAWSSNANRATNAPVRIEHAGGSSEAKLDQRQRREIDRHFGIVGTYEFGTTGTAKITNASTDGRVMLDAVRWVKAE